MAKNRSAVSTTAVVLIAMLIGAGALLVYFYSNRTIDDETRKALLTCGGDAGSSLSAGLQAKLKEHQGNIGAAVNEVVSGTKFSSDAEGTKQQLQFLSCMDRRLAPKPEGECTTEHPCADLVRIADFTKLSCGEGGSRTDEATFEMTAVVTPVSPQANFFMVNASPQKGASVKVFATTQDGEVEIPPSSQACDQCDVKKLTYNIPWYSPGEARYKYVWTNGHSGSKQEGLAFDAPNYGIRSIYASVKLPKEVELSNAIIKPDGVGRTNCVITQDSLVCRGLTGPDQRSGVMWLWDWNVWDGCPLPGASGNPEPAVAPIGATPGASEAAPSEPVSPTPGDQSMPTPSST